MRLLVISAVLTGCAASLGITLAFASSGCVVDRYGATLCPPPRSECVRDSYGDWFCAGPGGGAALDRYMQPACGVGLCIADARGELKCASVADGRAAVDRYGEAVCTQGCMRATRSLCRPLTQE